MLSFEKEISSSLQNHMDYVNNQQLVVEIPTETLKPITRVVVEFNTTKIKNIKSFILRHAFNHVMSDLVLDVEVKNLNLEDEYIYKFDTPKSASHILIDIDSDVSIKSIIKKLHVFVEDQEIVNTVDDSEHIDSESVSYQKNVLTDSNKEYSYLLTDGSFKTIWQGENYPANIDINLGAVYRLNKVELYFIEKQDVIFDVFGSNNGIDYSLIEQYNGDVTDENGFKVSLEISKEFSFVRVNILYNSSSETVKLKQIRVLGEYLRAQDKIKPFHFLEDYDFEKNSISTNQALSGIIERRIGSEYVNWFEFEIGDQKDNYFRLENSTNKIKIIGNSGVNIAAGLNYYLKKYCNVNITQKGMGDKTVMPSKIIKLGNIVEKHSTAKYVYSYNYTTFSYTMPFWGEEDWQAELDWLALNGVNLVLDPIGQEVVWGLFLRKLGYSDSEIQNQVSFSTYSAWQWMGNISGVGGPVSLRWMNNRVKLAHKNHEFMYALGMKPIVRAYGGLLPDDILEKNINLDIIVQGQWCSFHRPDMIRTVGSDYQKLAKLFYETQEEVLGKITHFYSVDPFHEGGIMGNMNPEDVSKNLMDNLLSYDSEAIWIIQSWQENPTPGLLKGINNYRNHALVLDLYAEKSPQWIKSDVKDHGGREFSNTPWLFCMLNNFGGRMGLSGHLSDLQDSYDYALNDAKYMQGIGITPEASLNNPILYDFFFDLIWRDSEEKFQIDEWLKHYSIRRYGASSSALDSLRAQLNTVYKSEFNDLGQGAPESIINARPQKNITTASTWGNAVIQYPKKELIEALQKLLIDYDKLHKSEGYKFDLVTLAMQVLSNSAQETLGKINATIDNEDLSGFMKLKLVFIQTIELVDSLADQVPIYRLETWEKQAQCIVENLDDFTKIKAIIDARALVTTWGSLKQANSGGLHDYSNRQWSGLTRTLYLDRWSKWLSEQEKKLRHEEYSAISSYEWFDCEWHWVIEKNKIEGNSRNNTSLDDLVRRTLEVIDYG
ncbi:alpha-N-acetylglucosaminidase [Companilactobacillus muriivasis]|uniref:alpha-N-acetylglucosaminidase n=1 Tax=Companilactobacillus muriivasis TaxID=3081444 RepID=UPI0030C6F776